MKTSSFLKRPGLKLRRAGRTDPAGVLSSSAFLALVDRERARIDRNGREFSVVVFTICNQETTQVLITILNRRRRTTEDAGWLQPGRTIGVILPDTPRNRALIMAQDVSRLAAIKGTALPYRVFCYPKDRPEHLSLDEADSGKTQASHKGKPPLRSLSDEIEPLISMPYPRWKRLIDICGATAGLMLTSPLLLLVSLFVKTVSPGPVLYRQKRIGFRGRPFVCFKFRTMHPKADPEIHRDYFLALMVNDVPMCKLDPADNRIITGGRILRLTGMDELPQLINVLRGEMSLVGPRPDIPYSVEHYQQWQGKRVETKPGLTGLWQVSGKNRTTYNEMMRLDIDYVRHRSLWLDTKIILLTMPAIIGQLIDPPVIKTR